MAEGGKATYCLEYAKSGRAKCRGTCKKSIEQGALRFGTVSERDGHPSTYWRCFPGCMTAKVISSAVTAHGSGEEIPGFAELKDGDKKVVSETFSAPPPEAKKAPAKRKSKKQAEEEENGEGGGAEEEGEEEAKPKAKKPRAKKAADAGEKKKKAAPKGKKKKAESDEEPADHDDEEDDDE